MRVRVRIQNHQGERAVVSGGVPFSIASDAWKVAREHVRARMRVCAHSRRPQLSRE